MSRMWDDIETVIANPKLFQSMENATVLVTGATGLIGSALIRTLLAANERYGLSLEIIGQIRNRKKAETIFAKNISAISLTSELNAEADYIIHTLSPTTSKFFVEKPVETIQASILNTMTVLETAKKNRSNLVYLSSMEQYGVPYEAGQIMTEDKIGIINHLNIRSSYSESKRLCECLCSAYSFEYNVNVKIARLAQTFGAGCSLIDNRMPMQFAKAAASETEIILHTEGKSVSNFVYLTDAVTGILTLLQKGTCGEAYNICNDKETKTVREIADLVANIVARGSICVKTEIPKENMGYAQDSTMRLDSSKLRALGWNATVSMEEAYRRLVLYIKEEENNK